MQFFKPSRQLLQAYVFEIGIKTLQLSASKQDPFEEQELLNIEVRPHLQTLADS